MKRLTAILISVAMLTQGIADTVIVVGQPAGVSYLVNQNFEGTGYDNSETWTATNSVVDPDYATSPAPLGGSQSLRIQSANTARPNTRVEFTANANVYVRFRINWTTFTGGNGTLMTIRTSADAILASFGVVNGTCVARAAPAGGTTQNASTGPTIATTYYGWLEYEKGTGSDAVCRAGYSTTSARPSWPSPNGASGLLGVSNNGTATSNAERLTIGNPAANVNYDVIIDEVMVQSTPFP